MNMPIDEQLLEAVIRKTGQPREATIAQLTELAEAHLRRLLGESETAEPESQETGSMDMDLFMGAARKIADKHEEAFRELAK